MGVNNHNFFVGNDGK